MVEWYEAYADYEARRARAGAARARASRQAAGQRRRDRLRAALAARQFADAIAEATGIDVPPQRDRGALAAASSAAGLDARPTE